MAKKIIDPEYRQERQDFDLFQALAAIDRKDYGYFSTLTEEQQRKFVPYMMLQWTSSVQAKPMISQYYVMSVNYHANTHLFNEHVSRHPQLQWLMLCASSPGLGKLDHKWIPEISKKIRTLKEPAKVKDVQTYFRKIYPSASESAITEVSVNYTKEQNHKARLAKICPNTKLEDIELLAQMVTEQDLDEYEEQFGI